MIDKLAKETLARMGGGWRAWSTGAVTIDRMHFESMVTQRGGDHSRHNFNPRHTSSSIFIAVSALELKKVLPLLNR